MSGRGHAMMTYSFARNDIAMSPFHIYRRVPLPCASILFLLKNIECFLFIINTSHEHCLRLCVYRNRSHGNTINNQIQFDTVTVPVCVLMFTFCCDVERRRNNRTLSHTNDTVEVIQYLRSVANLVFKLNRTERNGIASMDPFWGN